MTDRNLHLLTTRTHIPLPRNEVFSFFSDAVNLERITPKELNFQILTKRPIEVQKGTLIDYKMHLFGLPMYWRTLIAVWDPPNEFMDKQLQGPYAFWEHTHRFYDSDDGGTIMEDIVRYALPLAPLSNFGHPFVRLQLNRIFGFREQAVKEHLLGEGG